MAIRHRDDVSAVRAQPQGHSMAALHHLATLLDDREQRAGVADAWGSRAGEPDIGERLDVLAPGRTEMSAVERLDRQGLHGRSGSRGGNGERIEGQQGGAIGVDGIAEEPEDLGSLGEQLVSAVTVLAMLDLEVDVSKRVTEVSLCVGLQAHLLVGDRSLSQATELLVKPRVCP